MLALAIWSLAIPAGRAQPADAGSDVVIERFELRYGRDHPELPPLAELENAMSAAIAAASSGAGGQPRFSSEALQHLAESIVEYFNARGLFGVWVAFDEFELAEGELIDLRLAEDGVARITIWVSQVAELRTLARGSRIPVEAAQNHRKHAWIAARSPARPPPSPGEPGDLFRRDEIEDYLRALSTHPGRRVEASISSAGEPGTIVLDYLVTEPKSWQVFSQFSNTGTATTGEWRGRIGFQHTQLTNHDDVLGLDLLSTTTFENVAGFISYRRPIIRPGKLTARVYGSVGDFAADGTAFENLRFVGDNWMAGAEAVYRRDLGPAWDLSLGLGANYTVYSVATTVGSTNITRGESPFLVPFLNTVISRESDWWSLAGGLRVEQSVTGIADDDPARGYPALGRIGATDEWTSVRVAIDYRTFLEPLLSRARGPRTLAHEVAVKLRGRFLPAGGRLVPQEQELIGGAYSVRGYPESVASADEAVTASFEYGIHVPRLLAPGEPGALFRRPFAWRPPQPLRRPDWDVIVRGFVDYGQRWVERAATARPDQRPVLSERNLVLLGAGGGVEMAVKHNLSIRCDVGVALTDLEDSETTWAKAGDTRAHLVATFFW